MWLQSGLLGSAPSFPFLKYDADIDLNLLYLSTTIMGPRNAAYKVKLEYVQFIFALERNMEDVNFHLFAPLLGAERDRVWYKERLPGGPTGLVGGQPCPAFISKRAS